jgi:hypothetical protein
MRQLNKKQKKIIREWFNKVDIGNYISIEDMPIELYEELEGINDHETIYQNIERYINDLVMEKLYGSSDK